MTAGKNSVVSTLFGTKGQIGVNRGIAELHAGRPVLVRGGGENLLTLPVEGLDVERLDAFMTLAAPVVPELVITARRALALGLGATTAVALPLAKDIDVDVILALVAEPKIDTPLEARAAGEAASAAVQLVKLSQGLPAVLVAKVSTQQRADYSDIVTVEA